ncbi:MAG: hypothetical protein AB1403_26485, partial [Candidatus Riflebacteria bacterium]
AGNQAHFAHPEAQFTADFYGGNDPGLIFFSSVAGLFQAWCSPFVMQKYMVVQGVDCRSELFSWVVAAGRFGFVC